MNSRNQGRFPLLIIACVAAATALSASAAPPVLHPAPLLGQLTFSTEGSDMEAGASLRPADVKFITQTDIEARGEAEVSRLAISSASSGDVRVFAQQLVTDGNQIDAALEAFARQHSVPIALQPTSTSSSYRRLAHYSGADFDRAYMSWAESRAERMLLLCEDAVQHARSSDVRQLAGGLLPMLRNQRNSAVALEKTH